jgi:hypothetical protein
VVQLEQIPVMFEHSRHGERNFLRSCGLKSVTTRPIRRRAASAGVRGLRPHASAPPRTEFFFEADVAASEEPPHRAAAARDPAFAHRRDDLVQRQVRLVGN